jgi:hypothetical protein
VNWFKIIEPVFGWQWFVTHKTQTLQPAQQHEVKGLVWGMGRALG